MAADEELTDRLVPPGSWPCDPAGPDTLVARSAGDVTELAGKHGRPTAARSAESATGPARFPAGDRNGRAC